MVQVTLPVHTMKAFEEVEVKLHLLLASPFDTGLVNFTFWPLYLRGKRRPGEHQSQSECFGRQKNVLPVLGIEQRFLSCPAPQPIHYISPV